MGLGMAGRSFRRIWPMLELRVPPRLFPSRLPTLRLWSPWLLPSGVRTLRLCACEFWWRFRSRHGRGFPRWRRAPLDPPMSDIPRVVFPDYKRKLPVAMTQKEKRPSTVARGFFGCYRFAPRAVLGGTGHDHCDDLVHRSTVSAAAHSGLGIGVAGAALVLLALTPMGWRAGWWHFRFSL